MRSIRVLFGNSVDADDHGTQSLNQREIALHLDPRRFAATLFYRRRPDPRLAGRSNVRLVRLPPRLGALRMLAESITRCDVLFKPNFDRFGALFFRLPRRLRRRTVTVEWIEAPVENFLAEAPRSRRRIFDAIARRIDLQVAITDRIAETSPRSCGLHPTEVIPAGVNREIFRPCERPAGEPLQVLFVGPLIERKGPQLVLRAAERHRDVRFVLVGERRGDFHHQLARIVRERSLENVTFLPEMPQSELAELMGRSHVLFHPSLVESFAKVVLEGAATGLPGIMLARHRSPAIVDSLTGYQVDDHDSMLERLARLLENRELRNRLGDAAREHARQFDWRRIVHRWEAAFEQALAAKRAGGRFRRSSE